MQLECVEAKLEPKRQEGVQTMGNKHVLLELHHKTHTEEDVNEVFPTKSACNVNEVYLFHGVTSMELATTITGKGFNERYAQKDGAYGEGTYFADDIAKADQYSGANDDGR